VIRLFALIAALFSPHQAASEPVASPSPGPAATAVPTPAPSGVPASAVPQASPAAPAPEATPTPSPLKFRFLPHYPANPAPGQPVIYAVYLNDDHLRSHQPIMIRVETNDAVVKVETGASGRSGIVPNVEPRVFYANSILPKVPFIAAGMTMQFKVVGTSANGRKDTVTFPVKLD